MISEALLKVLAGAGIGSRRQLTTAIKQGRVAVNGEVVEDFRYAVDRETDSILLDGQPVGLKTQGKVYLVLNKPPGVVSTTSDEQGRKTVMALLPRQYRHIRLYPVGRLDRDSTGLLLLTNDGDLTHRLTHPRFEQEKEYEIQLNTDLKAADRRKLERGVKLEEGLTSPALVREVESPLPTYSITIHEGRKRQVRRMLASLGYRVIALKRVRMGNLTLGSLEEGKVRELSGEEIKMLSGNRGD